MYCIILFVFNLYCIIVFCLFNSLIIIIHFYDYYVSFVIFQYSLILSSSSVICQTTGPKPLPKWFLHIVRSRASSFNWQYPLLSLKSSSSFLRLLPRLLVTSICPFIFPSYFIFYIYSFLDCILLFLCCVFVHFWCCILY